MPFLIGYPTTSQADNDGFARELHHRVKNNFQIITSLISLRKRMLPSDHRAEARLIEEHVQCMAAADRIVVVTDGTVQVALRGLVLEAVGALRQIAGVHRDQVGIELPTSDYFIPFDQAVAIGLYLAILLPPYLDASATHDGMLRIAVIVEEPDRATLSIATARPATIGSDPLRQRLAAAYVRRLSAEVSAPDGRGNCLTRFRLLPM
jgi:hypothetical protein